MLANVMPGLRELRAPLAAGYLWLLWGWLVFGSGVPRGKDEAPEPLRRLYELEPVITDLGRAVVVSVAAYVVGSVVIDVLNWIGRQVSRWLAATSVFSLAPPAAERLSLTNAGRRALDSILPDSTRPEEEGVGEASSHLPDDKRHAAERARVARRESHLSREEAVKSWIPRNREVLKTQLLAASAELHSEVDRPDAEATFRLALWPPLAALIIYPLARVDALWLVALVLPTLLAFQWVSLRRRANDQLISAIAAIPDLTSKFVEGVTEEMKLKRRPSGGVSRRVVEARKAIEAERRREGKPSSP